MSDRKPPAIPEITREIAGHEWTLVEDFNALAEFEKQTGLNGLDEDSFEDMDASTFRAYVWAVLRRHHPEVTLAEMGRWITATTYGEWRGAVTELTIAMVQELGEPAHGDDKEDADDAAPLPGQSSGPSQSDSSESPAPSSGG